MVKLDDFLFTRKSKALLPCELLKPVPNLIREYPFAKSLEKALILRIIKRPVELFTSNDIKMVKGS